MHHSFQNLVLPLLLAGAGTAAAKNLRELGGSQRRSLHEVDFLASQKILSKIHHSRSLEQERSLAVTTLLDFSAFAAGDLVTDLGDGITVVAQKKTSKTSSYVAAQAMIFDSANPTGADEDLGAPNKSFGGPGVGQAGKKGKLFANKVPQGNVLIVSEDENASNPDDNSFGGMLNFYFDPPRYINTIGLLDNDEGTIFTVMTSDGDSSVLFDYSGGDNSFENVAVGKPSVKQVTVTFEGSGGISSIGFEKLTCSPKAVANFNSKFAGDLVSDLGNGVTVSAYTAEGNVADAMIFDTAAPTGDDFDLGTPNNSFGGPGIGKAGKKGQLFANSVPKNKALIISEDGIASNPDDKGSGGYLVFNLAKPTFIESIGLLDNDEQTLFTVTSKDGSIAHFYNSNGGDNSFELVKISKPGVIQITVVFIGSGAITEINSCA